MNDPRVIVLIVVIIVFLIMVFCDILILISLIRNKKIISRKEQGILSLITQQYDLDRTLAKILKANKIELPQELLVSLDLHDKENAKARSTLEFISFKKVINQVSSGLILLAETTPIANSPEISMIKKSMEEFSLNYRKEVVLYNQALFSYNYWVRFWMFRPISFILKFKTMDYIN